MVSSCASLSASFCVVFKAAAHPPPKCGPENNYWKCGKGCLCCVENSVFASEIECPCSVPADTYIELVILRKTHGTVAS